MLQWQRPSQILSLHYVQRNHQTHDLDDPNSLDASTRANLGRWPRHHAAIERNGRQPSRAADGCRLPPLLSPLPVHRRRAERHKALADFLRTIASKRESTPDPAGRSGRCSSRGALLQANRDLCSRLSRGLVACGSSETEQWRLSGLRLPLQRGIAEVWSVIAHGRSNVLAASSVRLSARVRGASAAAAITMRS
jgi:hypothetical protein